MRALFLVTKNKSSHVNLWEVPSQKLEGLNALISPLTRRVVVAEHVGGQVEAEEGNTMKGSIAFARPFLDLVEERLNMVAVEALIVHPKPVDEFALLLAFVTQWKQRKQCALEPCGRMPFFTIRE